MSETKYKVFPSYEKVLSADRHLEQRIITPFENALNASTFIKWEYCNAKYEPLKEEQINNMDYSVFKTLFIKFELLGAQDHTQRLKEKALANAAKQKRKTTRKTPK
ncbi:hypothetical protein EOM81_12775 [bacterium]|nr:hypothetical protein [bacterium]